jgi:hypothetical protein
VLGNINVTSQIVVDFGYCPETLSLNSPTINVRALPGLKESVDQVSGSPQVEADWIYAPAQEVYQMGVGVRSLPYVSRVFGLPKTHTFAHNACDGSDHVNFHIWALSFFLGMRLTATEAGFVDATPIRPRKLVDFVLVNKGLEKSLEVTENFWKAHRANPERPKIFSAAVHALFLAQYPRALQFEQFMYLYTSLDACYALASSINPPPRRPSHAARIEWLCNLFGMPVPDWANTAIASSPELAVMRNAAFHEAIFMGEPLGFSVHGIGTNQNITLEMEALICRLLVALIGANTADYVRTAITTRQMHGLSL